MKYINKYESFKFNKYVVVKDTLGIIWVYTILKNSNLENFSELRAIYTYSDYADILPYDVKNKKNKKFLSNQKLTKEILYQSNNLDDVLDKLPLLSSVNKFNI